MKKLSNEIIDQRLEGRPIKILAGDTVKLLVSAYDTSKGRIVYRMKAAY